MMNNVYIRLITYFVMGGAFLLSAQGLADFDPTTMDLDIHPFNIYTLGTYLGGLIAAPGLVLWVFKKWGTK